MSTIIISAAATTAATASALPAAAKPAAIDFGPRLIDVERAPAKLFAVQGLNGLSRFATVIHFHEAKSAGAAGLAVRYHRYALSDVEVFIRGCSQQK